VVYENKLYQAEVDLERIYDVCIVGAGIIGASVAMQLARRCRGLKICLLEKEDSPSRHQTGRNSGVIHSGIYYRPGSLKAKNCQEGVKMLHAFCEEHGVAFETTGKIIVATCEKEIPRLKALFNRGKENGVAGLRMLSSDEVKEYEPAVRAISAILVPITGIVDYTVVAKAYVEEFKNMGGEISSNEELKSVETGKDLLLKTSIGKIKCRHLINCAGLFSDRIARMCNVKLDLRIIPFLTRSFRFSGFILRE